MNRSVIMAIDPRQFLVPPAGSSRSVQLQNAAFKRKDFLTTSPSSILDAPKIINAQVSAAAKRTIRRLPNRIINAATNVALNSVTVAASNALDGILNGDSAASILSGGFGDILSSGTTGLTRATDQILSQTGIDVSAGINGITNNIGGGVLSGIGNRVIGGIKSINTKSIADAVGSFSFSGLFGGDDDPELPVNVQSDTRRAIYDLIGVPQTQILQCPVESQNQMNSIADQLVLNILDPNVPNPDREIVEFSGVVKSNAGECTVAAEEIVIDRPTQYASYLWQKHSPKQKFMFMVEFTFHPEYQEMLTGMKSVKGINAKSHFEFVVKTSSRPNVSFEYDEVNMYNFRTKVPKRTSYDDISMTFYDDDSNSSNSFYTNYMRAMSPISNMGGGDVASILPHQYQESSLHQDVIQREDGSVQLRGGASLGALKNDAVNIISEIKIYHVYDWGRLVNVYHMYNPKITSMGLDGMDMSESGNGNELEIKFAYDGLFVEPSRATTAELMKQISGAYVTPGAEIKAVYVNDDNAAAGDSESPNDVILGPLSSPITPNSATIDVYGPSSWDPTSVFKSLPWSTVS